MRALIAVLEGESSKSDQKGKFAQVFFIYCQEIKHLLLGLRVIRLMKKEAKIHN